MKKSILIILILASTRLFAQDTTKVLNLSLQARVIEFISPSTAEPSNEESFNLFLKWRSIFRATKPSGNTLVVTDTIGTVLLATFYNQLLGSPEAFGMAALMKTQIASKRSGNTMLNRLCTEYENAWAAALIERRQRGRKLLLGQ